MKGLASLPQTEDLIKAYNKLQSETVSIRDLALFSQWGRLDPRLAEILVAYLATHWRSIAMGDLIKELSRQPWPTAILVPLRFAEQVVEKRERKVLKHFIAAIESILPKPPPQLFFVPLQKPLSVVANEEVKLRSRPYTDSGYIGSSSLLSRGRAPEGKTLLQKRVRLEILKDLLASGQEISVQDYRKACKGLISARQAQRDLATLARSRGFTRARRFRKL